MSAAMRKTVAAATTMLEQYADLDERIALVEADRTAAIAAANQRADVAAGPMVQERDRIAKILQDWWPHAVAADMPKGKKSMQLGGCMLGMRRSKEKLGHSYASDDKAAVELFKSRFRKHTTRLKVTLDRIGTLKLLQLGGKTGAAIAELGFRVEPGTDEFFIERVQQGGTIGS